MEMCWCVNLFFTPLTNQRRRLLLLGGFKGIQCLMSRKYKLQLHLFDRIEKIVDCHNECIDVMCSEKQKPGQTNAATEITP